MQELAKDWWNMITLTRLSGTTFILNCDLIERVDRSGDTVVTLVDGKKYVVCETPTEVVGLVSRYRSELYSGRHLVGADTPAPTPSGHGSVVTLPRRGHGLDEEDL